MINLSHHWQKERKGKALEQPHRRNSIEPIIGHMKSIGFLDLSHLHGALDNKIHVALCDVGMNVSEILKKLSELLLGRKKLTPWNLWQALLAILQWSHCSVSKYTG